MGEVVWIETITGKRVNPLNMTPEDIDIADIAVPLSRLCRFTAQCSRFYSVGQHSLHVAALVSEEVAPWIGGSNGTLAISKEEADKTCLAALLHDAPEAYTNDISRPVKHHFPELVEMEQRLMGVIVKHYDLYGVDWNLIKRMDDRMLATEAHQLMPSRGAGWYLPEEIDPRPIPEKTFEEITDLFMAAYQRYYKGDE